MIWIGLSIIVGAWLFATILAKELKALLDLKGLLTANYVALKRINAALELFTDREWQHYAVPKIKYMPEQKLEEGVTSE